MTSIGFQREKYQISTRPGYGFSAQLLRSLRHHDLKLMSFPCVMTTAAN
jgi:hypothetical protein